MDNYKSKYTGTSVDHGIEVARVLETDAVRVTPQEFTKVQEKQARDNIDALGNPDIDPTLTRSGKVADAKAVGDRLTTLEKKTQYTGIKLGFEDDTGFIFAEVDKSSDILSGGTDDDGNVYLDLTLKTCE